MSGLHTLLREAVKIVETVAEIFEEREVAGPRSCGKAAPATTSAQREPLLGYID